MRNPANVSFGKREKLRKKLGKLIDAAQPEPPTTEKIINALRKKTQQEDKEACDTAIFPLYAEVSHLEKKP